MQRTQSIELAVPPSPLIFRLKYDFIFGSKEKFIATSKPEIVHFNSS